MHNTSLISSQYQVLCKALEDKNVKDALMLLHKWAIDCQNGDFIDAHSTLEFTYKNILKYTVEGISDPERQKIYNHLIRDVYTLADKMYQHLLSQIAVGVRSDLWRELKRNTLQTTIDNYLDTLVKDELQQEISGGSDGELQHHTQLMFNYLWVNTGVTRSDFSLLQSLFSNRQVYWHHKALFVSGITLSLSHAFSSDYLSLLIDLTNHSDDQVSARALTGLLLALYKYDARLYLYPELYTRLFLFVEETGMAVLVQSIAIQLMRTRETEKISKKLFDEIIPEVSKMHSAMNDKLDLGNILKDNMLEDKNPEWKDIFKDSPSLINKLEELTQWQLEGSDVFLATFKMLKHFSFFNEVGNWLLPFVSDHPEVKKALVDENDVFKNKEFVSGLSDSRFLCNSDKYSLILSIPHMPSMQKELMGKMFSEELAQMSELQKDEMNLQAHRSKLVISNQFIQDLYRLLKLHPQKSQFADVFNNRMDFYNKWFYRQSLVDQTTLRELAEFYFKKDYFEDALEIFFLILKNEPNAIDVIQKVAYSYQKQGDFEQALSYYLKAELIDASGNWLKKKIAYCYLVLKDIPQALAYYKTAERLAPDNLHTQMSIGNCLVEMGDFEEALKCYFKVEYLDPNNPKCNRPIAWCSFVLGKFDQAEKYYLKLLVQGESKVDLVNLGHVMWCKKQRKEALSYYQKSISSRHYTMAEFLAVFDEDLKYLKGHGVDTADVPLLLDHIRYSLGE